MYSSSRLVTLCLLGKGLVLGEELKRGKVTESLVRAHGIVDAFPSPEIAIEGGELERVGDNLMELLGMGPLGGFDPAIELGRAGRQEEPAQAALLAVPFELGGELAAAVDLDGPQRERHSLFKRTQERARREGSRPPMRFDDVPARDDIATGKVFHHLTVLSAGSRRGEGDLPKQLRIKLAPLIGYLEEFQAGPRRTVSPCPSVKRSQENPYSRGR